MFQIISSYNDKDAEEIFKNIIKLGYDCRLSSDPNLDTLNPILFLDSGEKIIGKVNIVEFVKKFLSSNG